VNFISYQLSCFAFIKYPLKSSCVSRSFRCARLTSEAEVLQEKHRSFLTSCLPRIQELEDLVMSSNIKMNTLSVDVELLSNMFRKMCDERDSQHTSIIQLNYQKDLFTEKINELLHENKTLKTECKRRQKMTSHAMASRSTVMKEHADLVSSIRSFHNALSTDDSLRDLVESKRKSKKKSDDNDAVPSLDEALHKLNKKIAEDSSEINKLKETNRLIEQEKMSLQNDLEAARSKCKAMDQMQDEVMMTAVENTRRVLLFQINSLQDAVTNLTNDKHSLEIELHNVKTDAAKSRENRLNAMQKLTKRGSIIEE
jgi:chromosome segregation ATPase